MVHRGRMQIHLDLDRAIGISGLWLAPLVMTLAEAIVEILDLVRLSLAVVKGDRFLRIILGLHQMRGFLRRFECLSNDDGDVLAIVDDPVVTHRHVLLLTSRTERKEWSIIGFGDVERVDSFVCQNEMDAWDSFSITCFYADNTARCDGRRHEAGIRKIVENVVGPELGSPHDLFRTRFTYL